MSSAPLLELPHERGLVEVIDEGPYAIDLDDRQPLSVARLERVVAGDVDGVVGDTEAVELLARPLAEAAPLPVEKANPRDRARA